MQAPNKNHDKVFKIASSLAAEKTEIEAGCVVLETPASQSRFPIHREPMPVNPIVALVGMLGAVALADALTQPRQRRSLVGLAITFAFAIAVAGLLLMTVGSVVMATAGTAILAFGLALVSNAKREILGEPVLFSDIALLGAIARHPKFYLTALSAGQLIALGMCLAALLGMILWQFSPESSPRLWGGAWLATALGVLALLLGCNIPALRGNPDMPEADVAQHGLPASILLHFWQWLRSPAPQFENLEEVEAAVDLIVIVQCESFADPVELFGDPGLSLPGLAEARASAWCHGPLLVSGFGAYTMRTEYGVLFGRHESQLGFRRFDPYLTAHKDGNFALPRRLGAQRWKSIFIHPHDLRFYGRSKIFPAAGFDELIGPDAFSPSPNTKYVSDAAVADVIIARMQQAQSPTLIHAVTIENHGPWPANQRSGSRPHDQVYCDLVQRGDAMLSRLISEIAALKRPAVLLFYGDHRPSIPGAVVPGNEKHTPYVLLRFDENGILKSSNKSPTALTPAELHHALFDAVK